MIGIRKLNVSDGKTHIKLKKIQASENLIIYLKTFL
jgi:hypothetical protein